MTLDKVLMPVPNGNPDVFEREWPLRVADIDRHGRLRLDAGARHIQEPEEELRWHFLAFQVANLLWEDHRFNPLSDISDCTPAARTTRQSDARSAT